MADVSSLPPSLRFRIWLLRLPLRLLAHLPWRVLQGLGSLLGNVMFAVGGRRRRIADINLSRCFPDLAEAERRALVKRNFQETMKGFLEAALAWESPRRLRQRVRIEGGEHLEAALAQGRGILVLTFHYTTLEACCMAVAQRFGCGGMYRPHNDPALEAVIHRGRAQYVKRMIERKNPRDMIRALQENLAMMILPDQDFGARNSQFARFFGIETAWAESISRLSRISGAPAVLMRQARERDGIVITISPAMTDFPGADVQQDLQRVSDFLEADLRLQPSNYLWTHRRFKTRPPGEPSFYN